MKTCVVDASFCLAFLLPDESSEAVTKSFADFVGGHQRFIAPTLLPYEVGNGLLMAVRRRRIQKSHAIQALNLFLELAIDLCLVSMEESLRLASQHQLSVYDAAYVVLAHQKHATLLSFDQRILKL